MDGFKRMGVLGDWEHPYKTMDPGFEAEEVKVFGAMYKKGYIYKGLKPGVLVPPRRGPPWPRPRSSTRTTPVPPCM